MDDPKDLAQRDHQARPLSEHFTAYAAHLASKGATPKHIELSTGRARRVVAIILGARLAEIDPPKNAKRPQVAAFEVKLTEWVASARLSDLTAERVQKALATLREEGRSLGTCNHYRTAIKAFSKWCYDTHRTKEDVLRGVKGFNAKEDRRHDRRTISLEELQRLIAVAERGPAILGVPGPVRALCYRLAVATGLRYSEIASIRPDSFDRKAPSVTVAAAYTKNGQTAVMPLPDDLANDLAAFVAPLNPSLPVFPLPKDKGAELLQADLAVAEHRLPGRIRVVLRLPFAPMPDRDAGRCRWRFSEGRATPHEAFDPRTDRPLHPAPRRGHRERREHATKPQAERRSARFDGRDRDGWASWPPTIV